MQFVTIATAVFAAAVATEAVSIPREHHARFLVEKDTIAAELAAWKNSAAGRYAKHHGFYKDPIHIESANTTNNDQLVRFFLSKLSAEKAQAANPDATFGSNTPFSLWTDDEFKKFVSKSGKLGKASVFRGLKEEVAEVAETSRELATSVDWTTSGCVAGVKDQGSCGSCWAFSSIAGLESAYCLKYGSLTLLSEQQVTSCDTQDSGCDGGLPATALSYLQDNGGVCTESDYPYTSGDSGNTGTCDSSCTKLDITITSIKSPAATEAGFLSAISQQPVSVGVAAGNNEWKQYTGGVLSSCSTSDLDHAVLAVGYDSKSYKLKNQWGTSWGNGGYINLKRVSSTKAACGMINTDAAYPVVA